MTRTRRAAAALGAMAALVAVIARNRMASTRNRYARTCGSHPIATATVGRAGRLKTVGNDSL